MAALLLAGCFINHKGDVKFTYEDAERYQAGNAAFEQPINEIDVNWVAGRVDIVYADIPGVRIHEEYDTTLSDSLLVHWYVDDEGDLNIQCFASGVRYNLGSMKDIDKRLTIEVPRGTVLEEINMGAVYSSVRIDTVLCRKLNVGGAAFDLTADLPTLPDEIDMGGADCCLNLQTPLTAGMTIEMGGIKKYLNITSERPTQKEGNKTILGDGKCEIDIGGVNCTLNINEL